uniref:Uncharacterized protein n=1 Tax=Sphaerodactylus townsendi TaxID=933632 RepID=A0ACB8F7D8_9SAUR
MHVEPPGPALELSGDGGLLGSGRVKRGWVWNQFFVVEEYTGTEPLYVGKVHGVSILSADNEKSGWGHWHTKDTSDDPSPSGCLDGARGEVVHTPAAVEGG